MTDETPKKPVTPERLEQLRQMREKAAANRIARAAGKMPGKPKRQPPKPLEPVAEPINLAVLTEPVPLDDILSEDEIAEIRAQAREKVRAEQKAARKKALMADAMDAARREAGTMPIDEEHERWLNEEVRIRINMPRLRMQGGREAAPEPIIIDQTAYTHGNVYTVPRAKAMFMEYVMGQNHQHVAQVDGRSRTYYNEQLGQVIYQGGPAAGGGSFGKSFDSVHRRPS